MRRTGAAACLLSRWTMWWPGHGRLAISRQRDWEGSILVEKRCLQPYPTQPRGEDTAVVEALLRDHRVVRLDLPRLYTYVAHGANVFENDHFARHWALAPARFEGEGYARVRDATAAALPMDATEPQNGQQGGR